MVLRLSTLLSLVLTLQSPDYSDIPPDYLSTLLSLVLTSMSLGSVSRKAMMLSTLLSLVLTNDDGITKKIEELDFQPFLVWF